MSVLHGIILGMTPIWVTLLVAGLGFMGTVGGAIGGVLVTQRSAEKREAAARQLESDREKQRWTREDAARTFDQRRDAYLSFYHANGQIGRRIHEYLVMRIHGVDDVEPPPSWMPDAEEKLNALAIYGTQRVVDLANEAQFQYRKMAMEAAAWEPESGTRSLDDRGDQWFSARHNMLQVMREELGIPQEETGELWTRDLPHFARYKAAAELNEATERDGGGHTAPAEDEPQPEHDGHGDDSLETPTPERADPSNPLRN
jgi:hypothetical protein